MHVAEETTPEFIVRENYYWLTKTKSVRGLLMGRGPSGCGDR